MSSTWKNFGQHLRVFFFFFRGVSGTIVVLHSLLSLFVVSTRLIRSGGGVIDSHDQFHQGFEQNDTFEVLEKVFKRLFDGLSSKDSHFWYFQGFYKQNCLYKP